MFSAHPQGTFVNGYILPLLDDEGSMLIARHDCSVDAWLR